MKKLLALLLALLLPAGALAETVVPADSDAVTIDTFRQLFDAAAKPQTAYCLEFDVSTDEEALAALLLPALDPSNAATASKALAKLLNGFGVKLIAQDDAFFLDLLLKNSSLMDFTFYINEDEQTLLITSSMMPGYALTEKTDDDDQDEALAEILGEEMKRLLADMAKAAVPLLQEIPMERTRGSFEGDAYAGGVWCTTVLLDDRQIAQILQALLTKDVQEAAAAFLTGAGIGGDDTIQELVLLHEAVAQANTHQYILRFVEDAEGAPVGLSATVMRGEEQLCTFSLGFTDELLRIVTGTGGVQENYWYDHLIILEEGEDSFTLTGSCIELIGSKEDSFAYALATAEKSMVWSNWRLALKEDETRIECQYTEESGVDPSILKEGAPEIVNIKATAVIEDALTGNFSYAADGVVCLSANYSFKPCDPIVPVPDNLVHVDMASEDPEQQNLAAEAETLMIDVLSQRMLTLLPVELMVLLVQMGM